MVQPLVPRLKCLNLLNLKAQTSLIQLKQIHAQLIINALNSPSNLAKLIEHYCLLSFPYSSKDAHLVLQNLNKPDLFLSNTLLRCTSPKDSILTFANWVSKNELNFDDFTYVFVLGACARSASLSEGRQMHCRILKSGVLSNVLVQTTLIHCYGGHQDIGSARKVFDEMLVRSCATWNAMIKGYCSQRERAEECAEEGLGLFRDMMDDNSGVKPNDVTLVCALSAAASLGVLETGACIHGYIEKTMWRPESDVFIGTGIIDMYSKCAYIDGALLVFRQMRERNVLTWTAMTTGLALHGRGKEALELLDEMQLYGVKPNAVTFTSLLSACCHAALVEEGLQLFHSMQSKFGLVPRIQHYGCIVDLLGRAGLLKEVYELIHGMPIEPDAVLWRSLLNACRVHGDVVMGEKVGKVLLDLQLKQNSADVTATSEDYVALSNVYALAERWDNVEIIRYDMKASGITTKPGCSFNLNHEPIQGVWACL